MLEFDLMREGLAHPHLPGGLTAPRAIRRDDTGRVWQLGGSSLSEVFRALDGDETIAIYGCEGRRQSFRVIRQAHQSLYPSLSDPATLPLCQFVQFIQDGMRALYQSITYGLLDDIAFRALEADMQATCPEAEVQAHLSSLMHSTTARSALSRNIPMPTSLEFDGSTPNAADSNLLRPLDAEVPTYRETESRVIQTMSAWAPCRARKLDEPFQAALFAQLYEFGQENFFIGARFRRLVGQVVLKRTRRLDYASLTLGEAIKAMQ